jgi:hypothetical protein
MKNLLYITAEKSSVLDEWQWGRAGKQHESNKEMRNTPVYFSSNDNVITCAILISCNSVLSLKR